MVSAGSADLIMDQAADWAVLVDYGEMTSEHRAELEAWRAADPRHRGAFLRARAALHVAEDAVLQTMQPVMLPPLAANNHETVKETVFRRLSIRRWRAVAGITVLTVAAGMLGLSGGTVFQAKDATATRVARLDDGSTATLTQDADIAVAFSPGQRRITLVYGEARFNVTKDKSRPFIVRSGDIYAQATGTIYSVKKVGKAGGTVRVEEGSVLVWARDDRKHAVMLHAGAEATLQPGPWRAERAISPTLASPQPRAAPRPAPAQISLKSVPIKIAVARFNRANGTQIVIDDPAIGDIKIDGLFRANEPETFAHAAATISGAVVTKDRREIVIRMK